MTFKKTIISIAATFAVTILSAFSAQAQSYRLPAGHSSQHQNLLANQRPAGDKFKLEANSNIFNKMREREDDAILNSDIYTSHWESQSVNPYHGAAIPAVQDIDVSGYVSPVPGYMTSNYGYRPRFGRFHYGVDLKVNIGDTVVSAFDGVVRLTKFERKGYGYYVVVRHDNGMETVYGHLSRFLVKPNQRVRAGEPIALGGNTGRSTGPHLHFETRFMGLAVNPNDLIDFEKHTVLADTYHFDKVKFDSVKKTGKRKSYAKKGSSKKKSKSKARRRRR